MGGCGAKLLHGQTELVRGGNTLYRRCRLFFQARRLAAHEKGQRYVRGRVQVVLIRGGGLPFVHLYDRVVHPLQDKTLEGCHSLLKVTNTHASVYHKVAEYWREHQQRGAGGAQFDDG